MLADPSAREGEWLRAERQTAGRGRQGRSWTSEPGNLFASTLVLLRASDPPAATLALVAAVALEEAVSAFVSEAPLTIKWPNDLLLGGAKVAGILLERSGDRVVIGFGVNCGHHPKLDDRDTGDLGGVDPAALCEALAESFARWLTRWRTERLPPVRQRWLARAHPIDTALTARLADDTSIDGLFAGLDSDGALILRLADGTTRAIHAADVFLL